jgi:putative endonuclease
MSRNAKSFSVYIMGSRSLNFYVGFSRDLMVRVLKHKTKYFKDGHTTKYNIDRLLYFENYQFAAPAIDREKQIKPWSRAKKVALIRTLNPNLEDLAKDWCPGLNADPSTRRTPPRRAAARSG